ncbi:PTS ascorbate transporter subunit IIC [Paenibacillus thiaminolyticus]|uniref:Ascorbate-specific PTS system EIIC component n=1 Tax=Paenibacillus thiaminolyticus TaxID=49283 RepID=A0AAP9DUJ0_PANTH|nr:PTS ascorbate transporter subunit IIC [Paenibacillus thiaminolyticus]MCY9535598.1 PTS ascorbate transporter subunit IIC [Paenibacillus thiaminolyticus]MCY9600362.1 PTS ascorbate transporter subunit IIC [Paenibacillus thiaminolyticus]MCY9607308.1 PTS ascorbate transporter subunit IIC [Paenibacillus thiaminolyticus]MCY9613949.1 PTS ascorbate transporter subunit IIC [Paenibacillus thiaminolyticus]MCY9617954.1 PTS ascorbate transporter subunit IIC [Paenibacillus thiaminolyticus]
MEALFWISTNIFGTPAILLGFIVLAGLLLQKKSTTQVISGTVKAVIGFLIINAGASVIVGALNVFEPMWKEVFGLEAQSLGQFLGQESFNAQFGSAVTLAMLVGFLINVLLARFTRLKYIYLTGHMMFWTATIFAGIVVHTAGEVSQLKLVLFLAVILGLYWTIQPALTQPFMRKITGNDNIALGHTSASVALLGALFGKWFGNAKNDSEKIKVPKGLEFLRDSNVITAVSMGALFLVGAVVIVMKGTPGAQELVAQAGQQNFIIYAIIQSLTFAGGIAIVLMGVRMFIGELVPAFNGIATRLVPGAKPALDAPIVFPYAPNAVILGFIGAFAGALIWLVVLGSTVSYIFVPTMIVLFFHGATAGVFGNVTGGVRGALIAGFLTATVVAWGQFFMVRFLISSTVPDTAMWAADSDMFILGPIIRFLAQLLF